MKKLPKVYANKIEKNKEHNEQVYTSYKEENIKKEITKTKIPTKTVNQKIREILNRKNHSYKIPVKITTQNGTTEKNIIGANQKNLITIENELIKIEDIIDIQKNE